MAVRCVTVTKVTQAAQQQLDYRDINQCVLSIGGYTLTASDFALVELESLQCNPLDKVLVFSEIIIHSATQTYATPTFTHGQAVTLKLDLGAGYGLQTYFSGQIRRITLTGANDAEKVVYTAEGWPNIAASVTVHDSLHNAGIAIGSRVLTAAGKATNYIRGWSVSTAIEMLFYTMQADLAAAGIPTSYQLLFADSAWAGGFDGFASGKVTNYLASLAVLSGSGTVTPFEEIPAGQRFSGSFTSVLEQICSYLPGLVVHFNESLQCWQILNIFELPHLQIDITQANFDAHSLQSTVDGRYSIVVLSLNGNLQRTRIQEGSPRFVQLTPGWDSSLEASWSEADGEQPTDQDGNANQLWPVYRVYQCDPAWLADAKSADVWVLQVCETEQYATQLGSSMMSQVFDQDVSDIMEISTVNSQNVPTDTTQWVKLESKLYNPNNLPKVDNSETANLPTVPRYGILADHMRMLPGMINDLASTYEYPNPGLNPHLATFILTKPAIVDGSPLFAGDVIGAGYNDDIYAAITPVDDVIHAGYESGQSMAEAPYAYLTYADDLGHPVYEAISTRKTIYYPGTADLFVAGNILHKSVDAHRFSAAYAAFLAALYHDILITGSISLSGDLIHEITTLNYKLLLSHPSLPVPISSTPALITGFTYTFGAPGSTSIQLSTDYASFVRAS